MRILAPISLGELIDKITILELKQEYIRDELKLENINNELDELNAILKTLLIQPFPQSQREALKAVNRDLWHIENFKRECEGNGRFDRAFIEAGREVYLKNDLRAKIKREINVLTGSAIVEEKSYK
jgi:hypothetical protein